MSFVGLYTGLTGVRAAQTGIDITSHNVANAATPGYTRQRVELTPRAPYQANNLTIGTGVDVSSIGRLRDGFLDDRFRGAVADYSESTVRADLLGRLEELTGEPDNGVSSQLGRLWDAAESWANNPADPATRRQVLSEMDSVNDSLRSTASAWTALEDDVSSRRETQIAMVNKTLSTLAELDTRIADTDEQRLGPDLLDQRDMLLDEIAQLTGAEIDITDEGRAHVWLTDETGTQVNLLEDGTHSNLMVGGADGETLHVVAAGAEAGATGPAVGVGGEIGGLHTVLTEDLPKWRDELNAFARAFVHTINETNAKGAVVGGPGSEAGGNLLEIDPDNPAGTIRRIPGIDTADLAAGDMPADPTSAPAPNDGRNARRFADLRTSAMFIDDPANPGTAIEHPDGDTLESGLADLVVGLAGDVRASIATADGARAISTGADLARVSEHGVSLDEEMVGLVRYQRSLEAASRVMTTVDEALGVLMRTGVVGR